MIHSAFQSLTVESSAPKRKVELNVPEEEEEKKQPAKKKTKKLRAEEQTGLPKITNFFSVKQQLSAPTSNKKEGWSAPVVDLTEDDNKDGTNRNSINRTLLQLPPAEIWRSGRHGDSIAELLDP
eukprot:14617769-Ditylum_brightwellii.AAC.1